MAHISLTADAGIVHRTWAALTSAGRLLSKALVVNASAEARLREVQRLQALSDDELAAIGIDRDRIVRYVFRDIYLI